MKTIKEGRIPIKMWVTDIEREALDQARNLSNLPFAYKHIALMPDCHLGYGMPIGGVMATEGVIIPNAVGVDIGCGMIAVKTNIKVEDLPIDIIKQIMGEIRKVVPLGFKHHKEAQERKLMPSYPINKIVEFEYKNALTQLGTLGGGNHFIEIQKGSDGFIWIMIHSGSRNLGHKVATHYNKLAKELNKKWQTSVPPSWDLAFLPLDSDEGQEYINEMNYCVEFALANRKLMMEKVIESFIKVLSDDNNKAGICYAELESFVDDAINIAHNYAVMENHFGKNVMVHRKGATKATVGLKGIVPGSQGTSSYIVEGLGNPESFNSCSHGAGRKMSRSAAKRDLNLEEERKKMSDKGIIHGMRSVSELDEAAGAYKDIDVVMENQKDLVKILVKLEPLAVIKG